MRNEEFTILCSKVVEAIRSVAPINKRKISTRGNLRYNAIKYEFLDDNTCKIYVDEEIAPYMKYTNESWDNFRAPLYGNKNPNEKWWDNKAVESVVKTIGQLLADEIVSIEME